MLTTNSEKKKLYQAISLLKLNDTFGFPIDLTSLMAKDIGWSVDEEGFKKEMQQQKDRSRAATAVDNEDWTILTENTSNKFIGYDALETESNIIKYRKVKARGKASYQLVLDTTPFYAESGGQVGDTGELIINNETILITDTKKENDLIVHFADTPARHTNGNGHCKSRCPQKKKKPLYIIQPHTFCMLPYARCWVPMWHRKVHLVNEDYLRFDFSHFSKMTEEEISRV